MDKKQFLKLKKLVIYTFNNSSFYRKYWECNNFHPSMLKKSDDLSLIPIVTRSALRDAAVKDQQSIMNRKISSDLHLQNTSGSSGIPLSIYWTKKEWRNRMLIFLSSYQKQGLPIFSITHNLADPVDIKKPNFFQKIGIYRNIYHDIYKDMQKNLQSIIKSKFKINVLKGMPSDLYTLSYYVRKMKIDFPKLDFIQSGGEVLDAETRKYIQQTFNSEILETYSSVECGLMGYQGGSVNNSFSVPNSVIIEAIKRKELPDGDYEICATNLNNFTTPIIRYQCGDIIKIKDEPVIENKPVSYFNKVYGKYLDFLVHPDGNLISAHVVKQNLTHLVGIDRFQVNQPRLNEIIINLEVNEKFNDKIKDEINKIMRKDLGENINILFNLKTFSGEKIDYRKFKVISSKPAQDILSS